MKKILLSTVAVGTILASTAQITVTNSNVASIGDVIVQNYDTIPSISVPATGASQSWDYSTGLVAHEEDTMAFLNPLWTTNASFFPTSNLAAEMDGNTIYLENDANGLRVIGMAGDIFGTGTEKQIYINPADEILQFPATYNDSYTTNSVQRIMLLGSEIGQPLVDSLIMMDYTTKIVSIDGYGTVVTPLGSFDAILVNETRNSTDSTWTYVSGLETLVDDGEGTEYTSSFWTDDASAGFPLMDIRHDNAGNVEEVSWLKVSPFVSVEEFENGFSLYPNPTAREINIQGDFENASIEIIDVTGRVIFNDSGKSGFYSRDVSSLSNGYYLINVKDENGNSISVQKFEKQ